MEETVALSLFESMIFEFRGIQVRIDADLASIYGTETKKLKQQVRRNFKRFPGDFMFELSKEEKEQLMEIAPRLAVLKHSSSAPMVFTEQGVAMLSSVLNTENAVLTNIEIMRSFAHYRAKLLDNKKLREEIKSLDKKVNAIFRYLLEKIDALTPKLQQEKPKARVGFRRKDEQR